MKKIEVYPKKAVNIFILIIFSVTFIISLCSTVIMIGKALKDGNIADSLPFSTLLCCVMLVGIIKIYPLSPSLIADENGITHRFYGSFEEISWNNIKRIYLIENDILQIEVLNLDEYLKTRESTTHIRINMKMGREAIQIPLSFLKADALKLTYELQNMLEEYKNAN